jgi:DNA polymerase-3 subunit delta
MGSKRRRSDGSGQGFEELLQNHLKRKRYGPLYVLVGTDSYRIERTVLKIRDDLLDPASVAFNFHTYHGGQDSLQAVLQQALSFPMLGARQVLWLREADQCLSDAAAERALERYCRQPVEASVLILSASKLDGRKRWVRLCREGGYFFSFEPPKGTSLLAWVRKAAHKAGLPFPDPLPEILLTLVGDDLHMLSAEIEKLALLWGEGQQVLSEDFLANWVMEQHAQDKFSLLRSLQIGNPLPALTVFHRQTVWGQGAMEMAPILFWMLRKAAHCSALLAAQHPTGDIPRLVGIQPWAFSSQVRPLCASLGHRGVRTALQVAKQCDSALKRSPIPADVLLELALLKICAHQPQSPVIWPRI